MVNRGNKMKRKLLVFLLAVLLGLSSLGCCSYMAYRQEMDNMTVMLRHQGAGDIGGSYYIQEYLLIILPESEFHAGRTLYAVKLYLWSFNKRMPDSLQVTFYDSQEDYENHESYYYASFSK